MASPDPTLLIQDLLSPPDPSLQPATLLQLITYHLSTIPLSTPHLTLISLVSRYTLTAPALWLSTPQSASTDAPKAHWDLHVAVYSAFLHAVLLRLDSISSSSTGTGWSARSAVQTFLNELLAGIWAEPPSGEPENGRGARPEVRLTVLSGVLAGLQEWKRRKEKLWVGGTKMLGRLESEVGRAWTEWIGTTLPMVDPNALAKDYPIPDLLAYLSDSFASVFDQGNLFTCPPLSSDLSRTPEGVSWASLSPSHTYLTSITQSPLFVSLGPLSRAIGRTLSAAAQLATSASSPTAEPAFSAIQNLSQTILFVSSRLSAGWASTPWSDLLDDAALSPSTRSQTQPWTILKSLLFAQTLVYSSLLEVISNSPSSGEPTKGQRQLAREAVVALGKTYFIASRFGQGGFKTWRAVLAGMVDVAAAASPASARLTGDKVSPAEELVSELEPPEPTGEGGRHERLVERAEATFWMNTAEQVMDELSDRYVEDRVLAGCRRYLEDATYPEPFESAHSVLLAVFSTGKPCVNDLAPWYTTLLLRAQPDLMSPSQLRFAFSNMVYAVSQTDDALAWWCIRELLAAIDNLPTSTATNAPELGFVSVEPARPSLRDLSDNADGDLGVAAPPVSPPHPFTTAAPTLESRSLSLPRGALLMTLIALLPSINLVLFLSLLSHIERLIRLEPAGSDSRTALAEWVFEVLGTGMDVIKRSEGARWWLEHGEGLIREEKEGDAEEMGEGMEERVEKVVLDEGPSEHSRKEVESL
ncbi:SPOSA6832_00511, partial [Sporobolomyces salmonicolor]